MERIRTKISEKERLVIPAAFRDRLGLKVGDVVELRIEDNELRITTLRSRIKEAQEYFRQFVKPGSLISEELIAERREAARHE